MDHQRQGDDGQVCTFPDDRGCAERNRIFRLRNGSLHVEQGLVFKEKHGVVALERGFEKALGSVGVGREDDSKTRQVSENRIVISGVMCGCRSAHSDTSTKHNRHLDPATAHILHFGDLVG